MKPFKAGREVIFIEEKDYEIVAEKAAKTHKNIKSLNQKAVNSSRQIKKEFEQAIKDEKDQWWKEVKHLMVKP